MILLDQRPNRRMATTDTWILFLILWIDGYIQYKSSNKVYVLICSSIQYLYPVIVTDYHERENNTTSL